MVKSRRIRLLVVLAAVLAVAGLGYSYLHESGLPHFRVVQRDTLYRSGQPRGLGLYLLPWLGIRTIVNLRSPQAEGVQAERDFAAEHGIAFHAIPVGATPESLAASAARFLAIMDDRSNWPVLVHCSRGKERAGVFSAVFRMEFECWPNQKSLCEAHRLGMGPGSMPVAEGFIRDYQARWSGTAIAKAPATRGPAVTGVWQE